MKQFFSFWLWPVLFLGHLLPLPAEAQGTAEDYERSAKISQVYSAAYRPTAPNVRWVENGAVLKETGPDGQDNFRFIDGETGKTTVSSNLKGLNLSSELVNLQAQSDWGRSSRSRQAVDLTIENTFDRSVRIFWSDNRGSLQSFGELNAGEKKTISTFSGHQWVIDFARDDLAGIFVASSWPCLARVDKKSQKAAMISAKVDKKQSSRRSPQLKLRDHNVWLLGNDGETKKISSKGSKLDPFVRPIHNSPDGRYAIVFQATKVEKRRIPLIDSAPDDQVQPKLEWIDYPKPGDQLSQRRPRLFDLKAAKEIEVDDALFANSWSVKFQGWSNDGGSAYFLYNRRGHQQLALKSICLSNGEVKDVVSEVSETFVDYSQKFFMKSLSKSDQLIWASERDGWNHLYRIDTLTGKVINQVTQGNWVVRKVELIDEENQVIWFTTMGIHSDQDPYHRHLARVNFDGSGLVVLTKGDGDHRWEWNPDRTLLFDRWSRVDQPEVRELRRATDGSLVSKIDEQDVTDLKSTGFKMPIRFAAPGRDGKTMIYGRLILPSNFDPEKQYPVIENIYAGPHDFHVSKRFGFQVSQRRIAELGFVVVNIDGMGTNWRSKKFHDVCYQNLADSGFPDRIAWLRAAAQKYSWLDLSRVGIYGGSAGGQNSLAALLHHGDFYQAAVSDCGCHDNRMDKIWWNEAWMGEVGPHYNENSNVTHAGKLTGSLLLTVGELDKNVDPASTMQVVNALVRADKDFDLVIYPGAGHGIGESPYLFRRRQDFFVRKLLGLEPRQ